MCVYTTYTYILYTWTLTGPWYTTLLCIAYLQPIPPTCPDTGRSMAPHGPTTWATARSSHQFDRSGLDMVRSSTPG